MKLEHTDAGLPLSGDGSALTTQRHHAEAGRATPPPAAPPGGDAALCDMMAWRLSHLDRMANWRDAWNPRLSMSLASTKGLMNAPGDNNCFLNSAVQVLWHLDVFRRSFRLLSGHACMGHSCIFCTLKVLFTQLQYSDRSTLPPDALRRALASSFRDQHRFQLGHMDDAAECFENILTRIHYHIATSVSEDACAQPHCIPHQKFAMRVVEQMRCDCGATTEPLPFTQMVHYVSANALVVQAKLLQDASPQGAPRSAQMFAQLLRSATSEGDIRNCPSDCGQKVQIRRRLLNAPDVVSIGLIWDSDRPTLDHIKDVVRSIGTTVRLPDLFDAAFEPAGRRASTLQLVGVVCYYGKHYSTFFFHSKMQKWVYFDDAHVKEMGPSWNNVADKCCRGHYQPLLLLYASEDCQPVDTHTAPATTTKLPGYQHFNGSSASHGTSNGQDHHNQEHQASRPDAAQQQYTSYTSAAPRDTRTNPQLRRAMTPGPEHHHHEHHVAPRRAITPGPDYGRCDSDEDETDCGVAHFRQSSYLIAVDGGPGTAGGEKVHWSKTATHGGDPYHSVQRDAHQQNSPTTPVQPGRPNNLCGHREVGNKHANINGQPPQGQLQGHAQGHAQGHPQGPHQDHSQGQPMSVNGEQYQYLAPQTHPPPVPQKPKCKVEGLQRNLNPQAPQAQPHTQQRPQQQLQQQKPASEYQDWTLSTSEPYRRQNMPKNQELRVQECGGPEQQDLGFVYPSSPSKVKNGTQLAKVNEIQRLESFKKGKGKIGADVVRYQVSPTENPQGLNPYGPLEPGALYPGHESGVMPAPKGGQPPLLLQNGQQQPPQRLPSSQSHPALKSEAAQAGHQPQAPQTNLKRTRSLENTAQVAGEVPAPGVAVVGPLHGGATTTGRTRPQSARPFENGVSVSPNKGPPGTPKLAHKRMSNANHGSASGPRQQNVVEGKPPRGATRGPNWREEEDPYGTLQYINRRAVENVLTYQHQKPGTSTTSRVRTLSQGGPGSVGSRSSNSSLESATDQLNHIGSGSLPPRPALPEALRVEIPGDNVSLGSHKDSGYRSGGSGGGDRNSASSMSSASVDSPGFPQAPFHQREPTLHRGQYSHPQLQETLTYINPETKSHSSTDSLSSGQSYVTVEAAYSQQQPPPQPQQEPQPPRPPPPQRQQLLPSHHYKQPQQQSQQQYQNPPQYQNQQQPHHSTYPNPYEQRQAESAGGPRAVGAHLPHPRLQQDDPQVVGFKAETLLEESNRKERDGDLATALTLCTQATGCLQQAIASPVVNSEMKAYLRMKHNACLLRSRALHRHLTTAPSDGANTSDVSTEDHTSISSQSTDGDVRELPDSPRHHGHPFPHLVGGAQFPAPGSALYEQQYSSDSGYSSHSMELAFQQQNPRLPHSYTDGALADHQRQYKHAGTAHDWKNKNLHQQRTYEETESNNRSIEAYATLPRKRSPKTKALPAMPVRSAPEKDKEAEVYQAYLQRQKGAAQQRQHHEHGHHPEQPQGQQPAHPQGHHPQGHPVQYQQPLHTRQTSNSQLNKEQIKQLLINDFMARKEGKKEEVPQAPMMEGNVEHARIRHMLSSELSGQMKGVSLKDTKRAQSELNLYQVDDYSAVGYVDAEHHPGDYTTTTQTAVQTAARGYMVHPDSRQLDVPAGVHHSRDSSCSSTTTLKGHSRENSLSSPPLSPKHYQPDSGPHAPTPCLHPGHHAAPQPPSAVDRDTNPPKPSMIGKLDKMHQQQQQPQQWQHQQGGAGWQAPPAGNKSRIWKSTSHAQLPGHDAGTPYRGAPSGYGRRDDYGTGRR